MSLKIGDPIPVFSLYNQNNELISSTSLIGKRLVLFFYPKNATPICTIEVCTFEDNYNEFKALDTEVIGISHDSVASHKAFAKNRGLHYLLLSDENRMVEKMFGIATKLFGLTSDRTTFIFDAQGMVIHKFTSQLNGKKHIKEALTVLNSKYRN